MLPHCNELILYSSCILFNLLRSVGVCYARMNRSCRLSIFLFFKVPALHHVCDVLRDLVPFVQIKNREKHPWRYVVFGVVLQGFSQQLY